MRLKEIFATLSVLVALVAVPVLVGWYQQDHVLAEYAPGAKVFTLTGVAEEGVWTTEKVDGHNYWRKTFTPATLYLEEGDQVVLQLQSADVHHRFYAPGLNIGPIEVEPGHTEEVIFTAGAPGTYLYFCDTICGECHFFMRGTIQVLPKTVVASLPAQATRTQTGRKPVRAVNVPTCPHGLTPPPTDDPVRQGEFFYRKLGCIACHEGPGAGVGINVPPSLEYEGSKVKPDWLVTFLLDPTPIRWEKEGVRPKIQMPNFGSETAQRIHQERRSEAWFALSERQAKELTAYLMQKTDRSLIPSTGIDWSASSPDNIKEGRRVFEQYQCQGCHQLGGVGRHVGPALDGVGSRLRSDYMLAWVLDPHKIVPGTPMQNKELWEEEAEALVRYLQTLKKGGEATGEHVKVTGTVYSQGGRTGIAVENIEKVKHEAR